ncbi:MAG: GNAT family N-acetyltransferase [Acidobacteria bacterium]|nr:GNAT family N-acetyltransferase [Acidobacteriota bacterium]
MQLADIDAGLRLCRASRWNQTRRDWELFLTLSPQGCRVALHDQQIIGTVATINYENRFSWVAMVLVDPAFRGQGIGTRLMNEALTILQDVPAIRLDATPAGQPVYRQLSFTGEYGLSRMEAVIERENLSSPSQHIRPMRHEDLIAIAKFDREVFGADRRALLEWMLAGGVEYAWVKESRKEITGYCLGRYGHNAEQLGPVVARDQNTARALVTACLSEHHSKPFYLDTPHHDAEWLAWLTSIGFREQRPFLRMGRGANAFRGLPEQQFAIVGPEFG